MNVLYGSSLDSAYHQWDECSSRLSEFATCAWTKSTLPTGFAVKRSAQRLPFRLLLHFWLPHSYCELLVFSFSAVWACFKLFSIGCHVQADSNFKHPGFCQDCGSLSFPYEQPWKYWCLQDLPFSAWVQSHTVAPNLASSIFLFDYDALIIVVFSKQVMKILALFNNHFTHSLLFIY